MLKLSSKFNKKSAKIIQILILTFVLTLTCTIITKIDYSNYLINKVNKYQINLVFDKDTLIIDRRRY